MPVDLNSEIEEGYVSFAGDDKTASASATPTVTRTATRVGTPEPRAVRKGNVHLVEGPHVTRAPVVTSRKVDLKGKVEAKNDTIIIASPPKYYTPEPIIRPVVVHQVPHVDEVVEATPAPEPEPVEEVVVVPPPPIVHSNTLEHQMLCHREPPTYLHDVNLNMCPCQEEVEAVQFFEETGEERKYTGTFPWWLLPLILLGLLLLAALLALLLCSQRHKKEIVQKKVRNFVIEKQTKEQDEEEIEKEIERQLKQRVDAKRNSQGEEVKVAEPVQQVEAARPQHSAERGRSSRGSSSKKVVKKRIVKMMKEGKLVAEKEEILDEDGNVLSTHIRKDNLNVAE